MASEDGPAMLLQAEKTFAQPVRLRLTRCCPTMDLVAVVTNEEQLDVYRFNGQRAFGLQRKNSSSTVSSICWKYNGNMSLCSDTEFTRY
jgi:anaphase-promoting complex subunit 4